MIEALIDIREVEFSYSPDRPVLGGCNFHLEPGQRVALTGANGSGKTTLMHLIVGLMRPGSGRIEIFGKERREEADFHEVRRRIGLLFQDSDDQLFCPTVAEDAAFGPLNLGLKRDQARQIVSQTLAELGLGGYENRITYQLSSGEKRLAALATVLAMQPDVLLLDEPTNSLDDQAVQRLLEILLRLPQAMILVSHDRGFREKLTDQVFLLNQGHLEKVANH
ncbi:MAG: ABC transporter ATP-binding protein [Thermoguttaceae bacterium]|jgi:cobalt/nickel transport system ATP-binding protein